ncbi:hypothetical protein LOAG_01902 [Loa loa]|uniref:Uncharacterized protein n=1 Tax=Loa loa TaxID=7209 RepID=A0A1S0U7N7_LOALO|nr:hypothetical protein LOAG_01902 [Loa loa]EFO26580.1 hypothetical protein LOAG_01902 [Loa loa]
MDLFSLCADDIHQGTQGHNVPRIRTLPIRSVHLPVEWFMQTSTLKVRERQFHCLDCQFLC